MRETEEIRVPAIAFLGEQDGPVERDLKVKLTELFLLEISISRVSLARVHYHDSPVDSVALCLRSDSPPERTLVDKIGKVFASLFNGREHLDILFLNEQQQVSVDKCCKPFFQR